MSIGFDSGCNNINFQGRYNLSNYKGCLKGGAIGDALGWPIEFHRLADIKRKYGPNGIDDLVLNSKGKAEITDDTQMTMFTADGLIKSALKKLNLSEMPDMEDVFKSYKLWLNTQFGKAPTKNEGWISGLRSLYATRAPGDTCISAIRSNNPGSIAKAINNSAGCGGVMRVAPAGLMYKDNPKLAFKVGAECAALTHSHPRGYLPAGVLSEMIAHIVSGKNIEGAVSETMKTLKTYSGYEPVSMLMEKAQRLAKSNTNPSDAINELGEGWVGDEAIAIASYCALKEPKDFVKAVKMAVNHNGDSDSTGAILGNILGAELGVEKFPSKWVKNVELSDELGQLAKDLFVKPQDIENSVTRYPID